MYLSICVSVALGRRLVQWTIIDIQGEDRTFLGLFRQVKAGKFKCIEMTDELKRATLSQVMVGSDKDKLMVTSANQSVSGICEVFGKYIKFVVQVDEEATPALSTSIGRNAFAIMANAQRQLQQGDNGVPFSVPVKSNKDKLFNDLIQLMKELGVQWIDPNAYATPFLKKLCEILWYIDGHHRILAEHAPNFPGLFSRFNGFNCPEKHKHRKRALQNLKFSELRSHSLTLQDMLQASWFKNKPFKALKEATEGLMVSLNMYAAFLQEKVKYQKLHHEMNQPSAMQDESSHIQFLPKSSNRVSTSLLPLQEQLLDNDPYDPISLIDSTPGDRRQRYK